MASSGSYSINKHATHLNSNVSLTVKDAQSLIVTYKEILLYGMSWNNIWVFSFNKSLTVYQP